MEIRHIFRRKRWWLIVPVLLYWLIKELAKDLVIEFIRSHLQQQGEIMEALRYLLLNPSIIALAVFVILATWVFIDIRREKPLKLLRQLRTDGVALRNTGIYLHSEEELRPWIKKFETWNKQVVNILEKQSQVEASTFEILNNWKSDLSFSNAINKEHEQYLRVITEKLKRLLEIMQRLEKTD